MISKVVKYPNYEPQYDYTKQSEIEKMIEGFREELSSQDIWLSVDLAELKTMKLNKTILDIMQNALLLSKVLCIDSSRESDRIIRIRTRCLQKKVFIIVQYSISEFPSTKYDELEKTIARKVEYVGGYFRHQLEKDAGNLKIALPLS